MKIVERIKFGWAFLNIIQTKKIIFFLQIGKKFNMLEKSIVLIIKKVNNQKEGI